MDYNELKRDIEQNGMKQPILVLNDGRIVNGYKRYQIAQELGLEYVPVVVLNAVVQYALLCRLEEKQ